MEDCFIRKKEVILVDSFKLMLDNRCLNRELRRQVERLGPPNEINNWITIARLVKVNDMIAVIIAKVLELANMTLILSKLLHLPSISFIFYFFISLNLFLFMILIVQSYWKLIFP